MKTTNFKTPAPQEGEQKEKTAYKEENLPPEKSCGFGQSHCCGDKGTDIFPHQKRDDSPIPQMKKAKGRSPQ